MIYIVVLAFLVIYSVTLLFIYHYNKDFQKEREALVDRIQSANLLEYKNLHEPPKPREPKEETPKYEFVG